MVKYGIGVGEDFSVDEPAPKQTEGGAAENGPGDDTSGDERRRHWHGHRHEDWREHGRRHREHHHHGFGFLGIILRVAFVGLAIAGLGSLFFWPHVYAWHPGAYPAYGYYPYTPHFGFFFPGLVILALVLFAMRHHAHHHRFHHYQAWRRDCGSESEDI